MYLFPSVALIEYEWYFLITTERNTTFDVSNLTYSSLAMLSYTGGLMSVLIWVLIQYRNSHVTRYIPSVTTSFQRLNKTVIEPSLSIIYQVWIISTPEMQWTRQFAGIRHVVEIHTSATRDSLYLHSCVWERDYTCDVHAVRTWLPLSFPRKQSVKPTLIFPVIRPHHGMETCMFVLNAIACN